MELSPGEFDSAFNDFDFRMSQWAEMQSKSVSKLFYQQWHELPAFRLPCMEKDVPIKITSNSEPIYGTNDIKIKSMKETLSHRVIRSRRNESALAKEIPHIKRPDIIRSGVYCAYPRILIGATCPRGNARYRFFDDYALVHFFNNRGRWCCGRFNFRQTTLELGYQRDFSVRFFVSVGFDIFFLLL